MVVEWTARLPLAWLDLGPFPFWLLVLLYAALAAGVWWLNRPAAAAANRPHFQLPEPGTLTTRLLVGSAAAVLLLIGLALWQQADGRLHVAFLDVGQGDAILLTLPDGRQILIDGGPAATALAWRLGQEMPFWDHSLDVVINTHPDADHLAGLVGLTNRFAIGQVIVPDVGTGSSLYRQWEQDLAGAGLSPLVAQAGTRLQLGADVTATLLNPGPAAASFDDVNNHSVVLHLQFGQVSFLFPGDIEMPVEQKLARAGLPPATVLKSPHHGSRTSSSEPFLTAVAPQVAVISVGADNTFGHPSPEVLARYAAHGIATLRTDERGTIELITDGQRVWVETAR